MLKNHSGERALAHYTSTAIVPAACLPNRASKRIAARFASAALCIGSLGACNLDPSVKFPSYRSPPIPSAEQEKKPEPVQEVSSEPLEPTAYVPTANLLSLPVVALPHLSKASISEAKSRPLIIWVGSSISYGALDHAGALSKLLKSAICKESSVACHPQGGAGIQAIAGNMEEELSQGRFNTVVFEGGVNDLHGIVGRVMDGSVRGII